MNTASTRGLTLGDAITVVGLLAFILAWLTGWSFLLWWYEEEGNDVANLGFWDSILLLALAAYPSLWASGLVKRIVVGSWSTR